MKKLFIFAAVLLSITAMAQTPVMTFDKTTHDFGKINEADGRVTTVFQFKNDGMVPLVLSNVRASCGCTTPKWTHEPIDPGATGEITVTYNPSGRPGRFQKTITVTSNTAEATTKLYIKGEVIPKPTPQAASTNPIAKYPAKIGVLNIKQKSWNFGVLVKKPGTTKSFSIPYYNNTQETIHLAAETLPQDTYLKVSINDSVRPGETGNLQVTLQLDECTLWGPSENKVYIIVNGQRNITDPFAITVKADLREDFSLMTVEQKQQAPIIEVPNVVGNVLKLDPLKAGKKYNLKLNMVNAGIDPLIIRRIISNDNFITIDAPKTTIKGGKKMDCHMVVNTMGLEPGNYSRVITIINNDPNKSVFKITISWVVE